MPTWDKEFSNRIQAPRGSNGGSVGTGGNGGGGNYKSVKKILHIDMETTNSVLGI